jgi:hypothetical protein
LGRVGLRITRWFDDNKECPPTRKEYILGFLRMRDTAEKTYLLAQKFKWIVCRLSSRPARHEEVPRAMNRRSSGLFTRGVPSLSLILFSFLVFRRSGAMVRALWRERSQLEGRGSENDARSTLIPLPPSSRAAPDASTSELRSEPFHDD